MKRLAIALALCLFLVTGSSTGVVGAPPEGADMRLGPWFESLRQPGTGMSCCSISDCRPVDSRVGPDGYEAWIDNNWLPVPANRFLQSQPNPLGRAVACYMPVLGIMCFVRPTEA